MRQKYYSCVVFSCAEISIKDHRFTFLIIYKVHISPVCLSTWLSNSSASPEMIILLLKNYIFLIAGILISRANLCHVHYWKNDSWWRCLNEAKVEKWGSRIVYKIVFLVWVTTADKWITRVFVLFILYFWLPNCWIGPGSNIAIDWA
jgi:hypothetical protein